MKFYTIILFSTLALYFTACTSEEAQEVIDLSELLPEVEGDYNYEIDSTLQIEPLFSEAELMLKSKLPELTFDTLKTLKNKNSIFLPDRLGYLEKEEHYFIYDSIPYHYINWSFEDSVKSINAFYNWLDCFNTDCRSIRINDKRNGSANAFHIGQSNQGIYFLESSKSIPNEEWVSLLLNDDTIEWNYYITQTPKGRINWKISQQE